MACLVKICGITNPEDAVMVSEAGADYLGVLVDVSSSPRSVTPETARQICLSSAIPVILLTFDSNLDQVLSLIDSLHPSGVQLAGNETEAFVKELKNKVSCEIWKSLHIPTDTTTAVDILSFVERIQNYTQSGVDKIVLDSLLNTKKSIHKGGTGKTFDWKKAKKIKQQTTTSLFLAGGINPSNVKAALLQVAPNGVDLSSGVETVRGKKNPELVNRLIKTIRSYDTACCSNRTAAE